MVLRSRWFGHQRGGGDDRHQQDRDHRESRPARAHASDHPFSGPPAAEQVPHAFKDSGRFSTYDPAISHDCRCKVILSLVQGKIPTMIAQGGLCAKSQVYRVAGRFIEHGLVGLAARQARLRRVNQRGATGVTEHAGRRSEPADDSHRDLFGNRNVPRQRIVVEDSAQTLWSSDLHPTASAICCGSISSCPSKSAIVGHETSLARELYQLQLLFYAHALRSSDRYPTASAICCGLMSSCPSRSTIVRAPPAKPCRGRVPTGPGPSWPL